MDIVFIFEWLDASWLAELSKSSAGVFAMVQTVHIASMVMLGGMVMLGDLRMMNVLLPNVPSATIINGTRKWIWLALLFIILSGLYEASAIAMKLAHNSFFFAKMAGLGMGMAFILTIRSAVYSRAPAVVEGEGVNNNIQLDEVVQPWVVKLVAVTSLLIWFSVASAGRWIGFS